MWVNHFQSMANGKIPYRKNFYHSSPTTTTQKDIFLVSPTEAGVQQAKSDLKRTLSEVPVYNHKKSVTSNQYGSGGRTRKLKGNKKASKTKKPTKKRSRSKRKRTSKSSKKKKSRSSKKPRKSSKKSTVKRKKSVKKHN